VVDINYMMRRFSNLISRVEDSLYFSRDSRKYVPPILRSLYIVVKEIIVPPSPEPIIARFSMEALRSGDTVIEVGARTGGTTRVISEIIGENGTLFSLEPNPFCIGILVRNTRGMRNVRILNIAAFSENGFFDLNINSIYDGAASLVTKYGWKQKRVRAMKLDDIAELHQIQRVDALILDAEGSEFEILRGSSRLLKDIRSIIVEFHHSLNPRGVAAAEELLKKDGFELTKIKIESYRPSVYVCLYTNITKI